MLHFSDSACTFIFSFIFFFSCSDPVHSAGLFFSTHIRSLLIFQKTFWCFLLFFHQFFVQGEKNQNYFLLMESFLKKIYQITFWDKHLYIIDSKFFLTLDGFKFVSDKHQHSFFLILHLEATWIKYIPFLHIKYLRKPSYASVLSFFPVLLYPVPSTISHLASHPSLPEAGLAMVDASWFCFHFLCIQEYAWLYTGSPGCDWVLANKLRTKSTCAASMPGHVIHGTHFALFHSLIC